MGKEYELHSTAQPFLDAVRSHSEPYTTGVLGEEILVYPGVMSPKYDWTSAFISKNLPEMEDSDVLEVGSGSGVLSIFAMLRGAKSVLALDVNPTAVKNTNENFARHNLRPENFYALESDLFSAVPGESKFDFVIFNAPFHGNEAADDLEKSISDFRYGLSERFFKEVPKYLKEGGKILYAFGSMGDLSLVKGFWEDSGFKVENVDEDHPGNYMQQVEDWTCYLFTLARS